MLQSETVRKYDTYKDSGIEWIGEIPQVWNTITLKRVFSNRDGGAWGEEPQNNENDRICIRIADFDYPKMTIKHDIYYTVRNYTTDVIEKLTLQKNDILIEKSGGGDQTPVGRTIIFNEDFNALYANFMDRLRVKQSISPKFIQYLLVSFYQNGITYQYIKQTTGIQNLDLTNLLAKESIVLPILDEQQKIADYLDKKCGEIDKVVETEKSVIEKLKEYKQSIITEAVTKGLDKSVPLKDSNIEWIGQIPQNWKVLKFSNIAKVKSNLVNPNEYLSYYQISPENIEKDTGNLLNNFCTVEESGVISGNHLFFKGQILYSKIRPNLNKVTIAPFDGLCSADMYPIETDVNTNYFLYTMLSDTFVSQVKLYIENRVKMPKINQNELSNIYVVIPNDSKEQELIAEYLDKKCSEIDKAIANKEQVIEKFTEYKKSLIYECVTGKKRVA